MFRKKYVRVSTSVVRCHVCAECTAHDGSMRSDTCGRAIGSHRAAPHMHLRACPPHAPYHRHRVVPLDESRAGRTGTDKLCTPQQEGSRRAEHVRECTGLRSRPLCSRHEAVHGSRIAATHSGSWSARLQEVVVGVRKHEPRAGLLHTLSSRLGGSWSCSLQ